MNNIIFIKTMLKIAQESNSSQVLILGSQSLYGKINKLPSIAEISEDVDVFLKPGCDEEGVILFLGPDSEYRDKYGCYVDVLDPELDWPLPKGWEGRTTKRKYKDDDHIVECIFLSPGDLCVSKLAAKRDKDINFVRHILDVGILTEIELLQKIKLLDEKYQNVAQESFKKVLEQNDTN